MAKIENLSPELLVQIFSYYVQSQGHEAFLRNIPRVCKSWNYLSSEAPLWRKVRARNGKLLLNLSVRGFLRHTQSLEIYYNETFANMNLSTVLKSIRDLKALALRYKALRSDVIMIVTEHCPHLERLRLAIQDSSSTKFLEWDQFFAVRGPTLKHLELRYSCSREVGQQLLSGIAAKCPLLESLEFDFGDCSGMVQFPIHELRRGCLKLKELEFYQWDIISAGRDDSLGCGFKDLKSFRAFHSDFRGLDVFKLLKDSMELESLVLHGIDNLKLGNISKIQSDKVRVLDIRLKNHEENLKALGDAVWKWRRTLLDLDLRHWKCDISCVLQRMLQDNPNPELKCLAISYEGHQLLADPNFFEKFVQKCQNLIQLYVGWELYRSRKQIKRFVLSFKSMDH